MPRFGERLLGVGVGVEEELACGVGVLAVGPQGETEARSVCPAHDRDTPWGDDDQAADVLAGEEFDTLGHFGTTPAVDDQEQAAGVGAGAPDGFNSLQRDAEDRLDAAAALGEAGEVGRAGVDVTAPAWLAPLRPRPSPTRRPACPAGRS